METLRRYWRQFAGWAIDLKSRYWHDPFLKSEINVIILQIAFALCLFLIASLFFNYLYQDILKTIIAEITQSIASGNPTNSSNINNSLEIARSNTFILFSLIVFILAIAFTLLVAKITLRPVKNALSSQKRFISDIAHELRTPLSIIKTNSEVSLMDKKLDPHIKHVVESNVEELDRMSEIINNLLSFNNFIRPERIRFGNVDIGPIIDSALNKLQDLAKKKRLEILIKKIPPHIVWGNAVALEQIVTNLLKNAVNYTGRGGLITISISPDYVGNILIHIEDNGIGISKNDLIHIFEPFYRAEHSRNRKHGSSGLGLTIVNELVKMHSGRITIKSAENKGTVVTVSLPYGKDDSSNENADLSKLNEISVNFSRKIKE